MTNAVSLQESGHRLTQPHGFVAGSLQVRCRPSSAPAKPDQFYQTGMTHSTAQGDGEI